MDLGDFGESRQSGGDTAGPHLQAEAGKKWNELEKNYDDEIKDLNLWEKMKQHGAKNTMFYGGPKTSGWAILFSLEPYFATLLALFITITILAIDGVYGNIGVGTVNWISAIWTTNAVYIVVSMFFSGTKRP
jgi:hypothetical protein